MTSAAAIQMNRGTIGEIKYDFRRLSLRRSGNRNATPPRSRAMRPGCPRLARRFLEHRQRRPGRRRYGSSIQRHPASGGEFDDRAMHSVWRLMHSLRASERRRKIAPTNAADVKKALANSEPSTHGTNLPRRLTLATYRR